MKYRFFLLAFFLAAIRPGFAEDLVPKNRDQFHLFLLIGQSNMAGRGKVEPRDQVANRRVLTLTKDLQWKPAIDPIHFDKPSAGVGLGRSFGEAVAAAFPGITVGLVPCAAGGSSIDAWAPGGFHAQTHSHPWDDMVLRIREAMKTGTLKAILWHQGESDANEKAAPGYQEKLLGLISRLRAELEAPEIPFICGQMGQFPDAPWTEPIRLVDQVHQSLPSQVANTAFVSSEGLGHKGDRLHFDSASLRTLGQRYAAAFLKLAGGKKP